MSEAPRPYPGPIAAVLLTLLAAFAAGLALLALAPHLSPTAATGVAGVLGLGVTGLLAALRVPPPHAERLGLVRLAGRFVPALLMLLPVALLASEVDNAIRALVPPPDAQEVAQRTLERLPTDTRFALLETLVVAVGLAPVVEEWFFRGILQQGLVASLGARAGLLVTALLFALAHGGPALSAASYGALAAQSFVLGLAIGYARHATGSLLAAILLHAGINGLGILGLVLAPTVPIPGYNAPGAHTPPAILAAAALSVGLGVWWLARGGRRGPPDGERSQTEA